MTELEWARAGSARHAHFLFPDIARGCNLTGISSGAGVFQLNGTRAVAPPTAVAATAWVRPPDSVRNAIRLMCAGAALELLASVVAVATAPPLPHSVAVAHAVPIVIDGVIVACLWLWMAVANRRGRYWARAISSVFLIFDTLNVVNQASRGDGTSLASLIVGVAIWLVGLAAVLLLYARPSRPFFDRG
jgi:hypothetical protein